MKIDICICKNCGRYVVVVDGRRMKTDGRHGHGASKCSGQWMTLATADAPEYDDRASRLEKFCDAIQEMK